MFIDEWPSRVVGDLIEGNDAAPHGQVLPEIATSDSHHQNDSMSENTEHRYATTLTWTPGSGGSTTSYTSYSRSHTVAVDGKQTIAVSADASFRGDGSLWNPEDMLVASLSSCHMLWYLHLCAAGGIEIESVDEDGHWGRRAH